MQLVIFLGLLPERYELVPHSTTSLTQQRELLTAVKPTLGFMEAKAPPAGPLLQKELLGQAGEPQTRVSPCGGGAR